MLFAFGVSFIVVPGWAGNATGKIVYFTQHYRTGPSSPNATFEFQVTGTQPAPCNTSGKYAVDISTPEGKAIMEIVIEARKAVATVVVASTSVCDVASYAETPIAISW